MIELTPVFFKGYNKFPSTLGGKGVRQVLVTHSESLKSHYGNVISMKVKAIQMKTEPDLSEGKVYLNSHNKFPTVPH